MTSYKRPLFGLLFLCFAAAILGDSTAEALLLAHFSPTVIPKMFIVNAAFLMLSSVFLVSAIDRADRGVLFLVLCGIHATVLLVLRAALLAHATFLFLPLFSYAYVSKILFFTVFWTLANDLIDSRKASAEFPFIAGGGTLGAIAISFSIPWLLTVASPQNLLLAWCAIVVACGIAFYRLRLSCGKAFRPSADTRPRHVGRLAAMAQDLRLVRNESLLLNMCILYALLFFILISQHYAFYGQLKSRLTDASQLASFLGIFTGISMGTTFLLQLTLAGRFLKKVGATRSMVLMPAVLCMVFGTLTVLGIRGSSVTLVFWGVVTGMGARIAFFDSFFSPNFQLFFSSLPQHVRGRGKMTLEGIIKPVTIALTSLWLMFGARHLPLAVNMAVLFAASALLVAQCLRIKKDYTGSLIGFLTGAQTDGVPLLDGLRELSNESGFWSKMEQALVEESPEVKQFLVELLAELNSERSFGVLVAHVGRADPRTRAGIMSALGAMKRPEARGILLDRLEDGDPRVVAGAVEALGSFDREESVVERLRPFLFHEIGRVRANATVVLWRWAAGEERAGLSTYIAGVLGGPEKGDWASMLFVVGETGSADLSGVLERFHALRREEILADAAVWRQFSYACSQLPSSKTFRFLVGLAEAANRKSRTVLAQRLCALFDKGFPVREAIGFLTEAAPPARAVILQALFDKAPVFDKDAEQGLLQAAQQEVEEAYRGWSSVAALQAERPAEPLALLRNVLLDDVVDERVSNVILIAAMLDSKGQIRRIVPRIRHDNRHVRARALEVLDNVGNIRLNQSLTELIETNDAPSHARKARAAHGVDALTVGDVVSYYGKSQEPWVRQCAGYARTALT